MSFFKYLFILFSLFLSSNIYAACEAGVSAAFESTLADPPYTVCASSSSFGGSKCIFEIYTMNKTGSKFDMFGTSTGASCTAETKLDAVEDPDSPLQCTGQVCQNPEDKACPSGYTKGIYNGALSCVKNNTEPDTLQCTQDTCLNPENKRCPSGYVSGSVNGQNVCSKSTIPDPNPDPDPVCEVDCGDDDVIGAVNDAKNTIFNAVDSVRNSVSDGFSKIGSTLQAILDKDPSDNGGNSDDDGNGLDLTGLDADAPVQQLDHRVLDENLFNSNASCPPKNVLSLSPFGKSFTYEFDYQPICDSFHTLSFVIMTLAYCYAAYIVVKA